MATGEQPSRSDESTVGDAEKDAERISSGLGSKMNTSPSYGIASNVEHDASIGSRSCSESPKTNPPNSRFLDDQDSEAGMKAFLQLDEEKQNEILVHIGIRNPTDFRQWMDSIGSYVDFDQFHTFLEEKAYLLGEAYYRMRSDDEQLSLLELTEEACHHIKALMKNDEETSSFPVEPVLRYVKAHMRMRWRASLATLSKYMSGHTAALESVGSGSANSYTMDFGTTSLDSISTVTSQSSLGAFSRIHAPANRSIPCFRTKDIQLSLATTGLLPDSIDEEKLYFHETTVEYATQILEFGLPSGSSFVGSDFGPGFYVNPSFEDARDWAVQRTRHSQSKLGIVMIFQLDVANFNIWEPSHEENIASGSFYLSEWKELVKLCRNCRCPHQVIHRFDGIRGAQCVNPNQMRHHNEEPRVRRIGSTIAQQLCVISPTLKSRLWSDFLRGIVIIDQMVII